MSEMKRARVKKNLKQKELAQKAGLSKSAISVYEAGLKRPSLGAAFRIAKVLGVSVDELYKDPQQEEQTAK